MSPKDCDCLDCKFPAEWAIYPRSKDPALAICLCVLHEEQAQTAKTPKQELYSAASALVRKSLVG